ncbi:MarR family transcriptional regulator [Chromobacterium sp. LK1]|nr:MarR family transcriptional regulator [Chromobacterium sp. LK1]KMN32202.1 MarR family transcriptional regulator [Chromobacterium sp. LK1]
MRNRQMSLPEAGEDKRGPEGRLGYLLRQAAAAHRLRMERALADLDITPPQFTVLTMLASYPGCSNADIARIAVLTAPTVTVIVGNLEARGAVTRRRHAEHGRILHIDVSAQGLALLERCRERVHALDEALLAGFAEEEEAAVRRWLSAAARDPAA